MTRPRGRAPEGERLLCDVPHGHWKTTTFLAALRVTGLTAPLVLGRSVVVGDASGFVHLLSREAGSLLNRLSTDGSAIAAAPVAAAGKPGDWQLLRYEVAHQETPEMREQIRQWFVDKL